MPVLTELANGRHLELAVGDTFEIRLQERPTTGFRWQIVADGSPICTVMTDSFTPPRKNVPGQAGQHAWKLRVEGSGRATIELALRRQWEPDAAPAQVFRITVVGVD